MRIVLLFLLLTACATSALPDARYIGLTIPTEPSDFCKPGKAVLRLHNGEALFTPDETTWNLTGTANALGAFQAERTGNGANKRPFSTRLAGTWTATDATGTYTTPRCTYTVQLSRY